MHENTGPLIISALILEAYGSFVAIFIWFGLVWFVKVRVG